MKDIHGYEILPNHYVAFATHITYEGAVLLIGKVCGQSKQKIRLAYHADGNFYCTTVRPSRIAVIPDDIVPERTRTELTEYIRSVS